MENDKIDILKLSSLISGIYEPSMKLSEFLYIEIENINKYICE